MLRELMEWAALLKLASQPPVKLLIRDGLLRSVLLTDAVFQRLREKFEKLTTKHGHLLAGGGQAVAGAELSVGGSGVEREFQRRQACLSARAR